jgi:acyl-CoA thioesterase-1
MVPFLLDGVAGVERLNQRDGIHPTAEGATRVADNIWPVLRLAAERAAKVERTQPAAP